jgi:hypothetical protein
MLAHSSFCAATTNFLPAFDQSWLIACVFTVTYFAPALVAFFRRQQNRWFILILNFLFGWTLVGWIICLAWAARAPSGEPVVMVQPVPQLPSGSIASFQPAPGATFTQLDPAVAESMHFQTDESEFFNRRRHSIKRFLFRLAAAGIALAVIAGITASQWQPRPSSLPPSSSPKNRIHRVPQLRNIDPYMPPSTPLKRRYAPPALESHEGYY